MDAKDEISEFIDSKRELEESITKAVEKFAGELGLRVNIRQIDISWSQSYSDNMKHRDLLIRASIDT